MAEQEAAGALEEEQEQQQEEEDVSPMQRAVEEAALGGARGVPTGRALAAGVGEHNLAEQCSLWQQLMQDPELKLRVVYFVPHARQPAEQFACARPPHLVFLDAAQVAALNMQHVFKGLVPLESVQVPLEQLQPQPVPQSHAASAPRRDSRLRAHMEALKSSSDKTQGQSKDADQQDKAAAAPAASSNSSADGVRLHLVADMEHQHAALLHGCDGLDPRRAAVFNAVHWRILEETAETHFNGITLKTLADNLWLDHLVLKSFVDHLVKLGVLVQVVAQAAHRRSQEEDVYAVVLKRFENFRPQPLPESELIKLLSSCKNRAAPLSDVRAVLSQKWHLVTLSKYMNRLQKEGYLRMFQADAKGKTVEDDKGNTTEEPSKSARCLQLIAPVHLVEFEANAQDYAEPQVLAMVRKGAEHGGGSADGDGDGVTHNEIRHRFDMTKSSADTVLSSLMKRGLVHPSDATAWNPQTRFLPGPAAEATQAHADAGAAGSAKKSKVGASGRVASILEQGQRRQRIIEKFIQDDKVLFVEPALNVRLQQAEVQETGDPNLPVCDRKTMIRLLGKLKDAGKLHMFDVAVELASGTARSASLVADPDVAADSEVVREALSRKKREFEATRDLTLKKEDVEVERLVYKKEKEHKWTFEPYGQATTKQEEVQGPKREKPTKRRRTDEPQPAQRPVQEQPAPTPMAATVPEAPHPQGAHSQPLVQPQPQPLVQPVQQPSSHDVTGVVPMDVTMDLPASSSVVLPTVLPAHLPEAFEGPAPHSAADTSSTAVGATVPVPAPAPAPVLTPVPVPESASPSVQHTTSAKKQGLGVGTSTVTGAGTGTSAGAGGGTKGNRARDVTAFYGFCAQRMVRARLLHHHLFKVSTQASDKGSAFVVMETSTLGHEQASDAQEAASAGAGTGDAPMAASDSADGPAPTTVEMSATPGMTMQDALFTMPVQFYLKVVGATSRLHEFDQAVDPNAEDKPETLADLPQDIKTGLIWQKRRQRFELPVHDLKKLGLLSLNDNEIRLTPTITLVDTSDAAMPAKTLPLDSKEHIDEFWDLLQHICLHTSKQTKANHAVAGIDCGFDLTDRSAWVVGGRRAAASGTSAPKATKRKGQSDDVAKKTRTKPATPKTKKRRTADKQGASSTHTRSNTRDRFSDQEDRLIACSHVVFASFGLKTDWTMVSELIKSHLDIEKSREQLRRRYSHIKRSTNYGTQLDTLIATWTQHAKKEPVPEKWTVDLLDSYVDKVVRDVKESELERATDWQMQSESIEEMRRKFDFVDAKQALGVAPEAPAANDFPALLPRLQELQEMIKMLAALNDDEEYCVNKEILVSLYGEEDFDTCLSHLLSCGVLQHTKAARRKVQSREFDFSTSSQRALRSNLPKELWRDIRSAMGKMDKEIEQFYPANGGDVAVLLEGLSEGKLQLDACLVEQFADPQAASASESAGTRSILNPNLQEKDSKQYAAEKLTRLHLKPLNPEGLGVKPVLRIKPAILDHVPEDLAAPKSFDEAIQQLRDHEKQLQLLPSETQVLVTVAEKLKQADHRGLDSRELLAGFDAAKVSVPSPSSGQQWRHVAEYAAVLEHFKLLARTGLGQPEVRFVSPFELAPVMPFVRDGGDQHELPTVVPTLLHAWSLPSGKHNKAFHNRLVRRVALLIYQSPGVSQAQLAEQLATYLGLRDLLIILGEVEAQGLAHRRRYFTQRPARCTLFSALTTTRPVDAGCAPCYDILEGNGVEDHFFPCPTLLSSVATMQAS